MACPVCGKPSPCAHEKRANPGVDSAVADLGQSVARALEHPLPAASAEMQERVEPAPWRREVVSRVRQHRARRHKRSSANATMELDFPAELEPAPASHPEQTRGVPRPELPKIIEFPRPATSIHLQKEHAEEQLAEPMLEAPRILDAPEPPAQQMDLLPAFADIQLKAEESKVNEEVELPPQAAPLMPRTFAALVDATMVLFASALFASGFVRFAGTLPQKRLMALSGLLVCGSIWLIYQYLFLVYSTATPGMQVAQLELCTFKGKPASLSLRRWRALASLLSAFALGLGFAWALVDEDTLGWHDRMTQTHLRKSVISS